MDLLDLAPIDVTENRNDVVDVPKNLYMCESLAELEKKVCSSRITQLPTSLREAMASFKKYFYAGLQADTERDEELAYLNYKRATCKLTFNAYMQIFVTNHHETGILKELEEGVALMTTIVGFLEHSLSSRYESLRIKKLCYEMKIRPILEQHVYNLDAERRASRNVRKAQEELGSLLLAQQMLEQDIKQQHGNNCIAADDNVPEQLKCPVCFDIFQEEIIQCMNGHSICFTCYNDVQILVCPECRIDFSDPVVRNRSLEGLVSAWKMDCPFRERGCKGKLLCKQMTDHVDTCCFRKSEEERQMIKLKTEIKEKKELLSKYEDAFQETYMRRMQTETEWRKIENDSRDNKSESSVLETIVKDLNLREMEMEVLQITSINGVQLSLV